MNLGELKQSLSKLPPDMDDMEILLLYSNDEINTVLEHLAFTGYIPTAQNECIVLGAMSEFKRRVKSGETESPNGPQDSSL